MISWPGNKTRQMQTLMKFVPADLPSNCGICEPFFGTGAFTRELIERGHTGPVFAAEANGPLRNWWKWMLADADLTIGYMDFYRGRYGDAKTDREVFNELRDGWNELWVVEPEGVDTAAMLWVLIYQSTNNLARFNRDGKYNQTWGTGRNVPDPEQVFGDRELAVLKQLSDGVGRGCFVGDFRECLSLAGGGVFSYLDPPYILETGMYQTDCWGLEQLAEMVERLRGVGGRWVWTDYLKNGGVWHPHLDEISERYEVFHFPRGKNARPNGSSDEKLEVVVSNDVSGCDLDGVLFVDLTGAVGSGKH